MSETDRSHWSDTFIFKKSTIAYKAALTKCQGVFSHSLREALELTSRKRLCGILHVCISITCQVYPVWILVLTQQQWRLPSSQSFRNCPNNPIPSRCFTFFCRR